MWRTQEVMQDWLRKVGTAMGERWAIALVAGAIGRDSIDWAKLCPFQLTVTAGVATNMKHHLVHDEDSEGTIVDKDDNLNDKWRCWSSPTMTEMLCW